MTEFAPASDNPSALSGLLRVQLLSNRVGALAALQLVADPACPATTIERLASSLSDLCQRLPCVFDPTDTEVSLAGALSAAGAMPTAPGALADASAKPGPDLNAAIQWLPGDWYLQPPTQPISQHGNSRALALKLVQLVATEADTRDIEDVFRRDSSLSYHLLRLVNSVAMGLNRRITSFSQAIIVLGRQQLRRWLNFILFAARDDDPRSAMLLAKAAVRARALELLAKAAGLDRGQQDQAFMVGMFSLLGVLFGQPLSHMLPPLGLGDNLQAALLTREGALGQLLKILEASEQGDGMALQQGLQTIALASDDFSGLSIEAHGWMLDAVYEPRTGSHD